MMDTSLSFYYILIFFFKLHAFMSIIADLTGKNGKGDDVFFCFFFSIARSKFEFLFALYIVFGRRRAKETRGKELTSNQAPLRDYCEGKNIPKKQLIFKGIVEMA